MFTGVLDVTDFKAGDDAGLGFIIGHEIAHVLAHHGAEKMSWNFIGQSGVCILSEWVVSEYYTDSICKISENRLDENDSLRSH